MFGEATISHVKIWFIIQLIANHSFNRLAIRFVEIQPKIGPSSWAHMPRISKNNSMAFSRHPHSWNHTNPYMKGAKGSQDPFQSPRRRPHQPRLWSFKHESQATERWVDSISYDFFFLKSPLTLRWGCWRWRHQLQCGALESFVKSFKSMKPKVSRKEKIWYVLIWWFNDSNLRYLYLYSNSLAKKLRAGPSQQKSPWLSPQFESSRLHEKIWHDMTSHASNSCIFLLNEFLTQSRPRRQAATALA